MEEKFTEQLNQFEACNGNSDFTKFNLTGFAEKYESYGKTNRFTGYYFSVNQALRNSLYHVILKPYLEMFGHEQLYVMLLENYSVDRKNELMKIAKFLNFDLNSV